MKEQKKRKFLMVAGALCLTAVILTGCQDAAVPPNVEQEAVVKKEFSFMVVDADGNEVPDVADTLTFSITGAAESDFGTAGRRAVILGTGSSNCDPVPPKSRTRRMENGRAAVCVRTGEGVTRIVVHGDRLGWASLEL